MSETIAPMSPQDVLIAVILVTAIADDRMTDREYHEIVATVDLLPIFRGYDKSRLDGIIDTVKDLLEQDEGIENLIGMVRSVLEDRHYETAYALACDVAAADGSVALTEMRFLEALRHGLDIDRLNAAAIERGARARHMRS